MLPQSDSSQNRVGSFNDPPASNPQITSGLRHIDLGSNNGLEGYDGSLNSSQQTTAYPSRPASPKPNDRSNSQEQTQQNVRTFCLRLSTADSPSTYLLENAR